MNKDMYKLLDKILSAIEDLEDRVAMLEKKIKEYDKYEY